MEHAQFPWLSSWYQASPLYIVQLAVQREDSATRDTLVDQVSR